MKVTAQAIRYGVVGVIAFFVDYGVTWFALKALPLIAANTLGFLLANIANFAMAHRWVFGHEWTKEKLLATYLSVLGISVVGLVLNNLVVWALVGVAGMSLLFGKVAATAIVMIWNFLARLFWVYKRK